LDPVGKRLGDYLVGPELGRGGMGTVYRAEALASGVAGPAGTAVAIKIFHPHLLQEAGAFERFRREAEIGKRIRHAHVVRTFDIGSAVVDGQDVHYMVMEVIEGQTLSDLVAELGTVPDHLLFQIADQALQALEAIHERGIIHRDIKPGNIVITPDHRVLLMDLGVARLQAEGQTLTQAGEFVGSIAYAAPEQFLPTERIGARVDLYAMGIVLFELATGRSPYDTKDLAALLSRKLKDEIPAPRVFRPDLDAFLNEVIVAATRKEPASRFASAAEFRRVLAEGEEGEWWRRRSTGLAVPAAERALRRLRLEREAPLTGRADDLAKLRLAWTHARDSLGHVALLTGPSGVGKSRLLYDFLEQVAAAGGPLIAAGRAVGSGGRSYQPFLEALNDLLDPGGSDPADRRARLEERLRGLLSDTPGIVPHFVEFLLGGVQPGLEAGFTDDALRAACARIVQRVAAERPLILAIEDLQLAGAETLDLFRYLARAVPGSPALLLGVLATDEIEEGSALHDLLARASEADIETIALAPLPFAATEVLVRALVVHERTVRELARPLHERGDGNPAIVLEMIAHLKQGAALVADGPGLALEGALDESAVPRTARDLVGLKLGRLDDEQRETLEAAAVLGYEFDAGLLADVLGEQKIRLLKRLATLERKHRLLVSSGKSSFRFAGRQVYEAVYDSITPALRTEYHAVVADTILSEGGPGEEGETKGGTAFSLLYHLVHADRAEEALPFLDPALDYVAASFHASYATPFLEKANAALAASPPANRLAIAMKLWAFYELLARRADQLRVLTQARENADALGEAGPRARAYACLAHTHAFTGEAAKAQEEAEAALALARDAKDRKWEGNTLNLLGVLAFRRGEFPVAAERWREALAIRREIGDRRGEASSLQGLGGVMPLIGEGEKALDTLQDALAIAKEIGDRRVECVILNNIAISLVDALRVEEGLERFDQAIGISRELGAATQEAYQLCNLGHAYSILGQVDKARSSFERALGLFSALDNPQGELATLTLLGLVLTAFGEYATARERLEAALAIAKRVGAKGKIVAAERALGKLAHVSGARAEAWKRFDETLRLEDELSIPASRRDTLMDMADAALREEDFARAADLLEDARTIPVKGPTGERDAILALCRLARARRGLGSEADAVAAAEEAERRLDALGRMTPDVGTEIHFTLRDFAIDEERRRHHLERAHAFLEKRQNAIRNDGYREHYLTRTWPNAEILSEAHRIFTK
jgi:tetratricopeptide (TPR) repeat protein/predicted Ser/Thr protein kinase